MKVEAKRGQVGFMCATAMRATIAPKKDEEEDHDGDEVACQQWLRAVVERGELSFGQTRGILLGQGQEDGWSGGRKG